MTVVTYRHRYKRPPKKRAQVARITQPVVTHRAKPGRFGEAPDQTSEEHRRRGDAADALFWELVRRATAKP